WRKKELIKENIMFDEALITATDYLYHIQALEKKFRPHINNQVLVHQGIHPQRLRELTDKSASKLKVNFYLISRKKRLNLNKESIDFLNRQALKQLSKLFKIKKWKSGVFHAQKILRVNYQLHTKISVLRLLVFGTA